MKAKLGLPQDEIMDVIRSFKSAFRTVGAFSGVINLLLLVPSLYMLQVYDRVLTSRNITTLVMLTVIMLGLFVLMALLEWVRSQVLIRVSVQTDMKLGQRVYEAAFDQCLKRPETNGGQALNDLTTVRQFMTGGGLVAFFDAPWFPIYLGVMFLFDVWIGLFAVFGTLVLIGLTLLSRKLTDEPMKKASGLAVRASQDATNNLRNAEVVEAMGMLPAMRARWQKINAGFLTLQTGTSSDSAAISAATRSTRLALQSLTLGLGAALVLLGDLKPGMMIAASILMGRTLGPVEQVIGAWRQFVSARSAYERLTAMMQANPARGRKMRLPPPQGKIHVEALTAGAPGATTPFLRNVTFSLEPGDILGVIGPSASGKSMLARLLVGVWASSFGKVRIDGADMAQWNREELGPYLGYLPQDIELFSGTVSENIARFGQVDPDKVVEAARRAGVHELILRLPKGYDTPLGSDGAGLSGGQKQRIALARALYGTPVFVVLDEPNSNLDEAGEQALVASVEQMRRDGRTAVLITHRTSILSRTTKLLVMKDGAVQAFGPTQFVLDGLQKHRQEMESRQPALARPAGVQNAEVNP